MWHVRSADTAMKCRQVCTSTLHDKSRKQANPRLFQKHTHLYQLKSLLSNWFRSLFPPPSVF